MKDKIICWIGLDWSGFRRWYWKRTKGMYLWGINDFINDTKNEPADFSGKFNNEKLDSFLDEVTARRPK